MNTSIADIKDPKSNLDTLIGELNKVVENSKTIKLISRR